MPEQLCLPQSPKLNVGPLSRAFKNTTATYKYYWLLALLQFASQSNSVQVEARQLAISMISLAWYPITYFRLSFGAWDRLGILIDQLQKNHLIQPDLPAQDVVSRLADLAVTDTAVCKQIDSLLRYVPYKFLSPWIPEQNDLALASRSRNYENQCLYSLHEVNDSMVVRFNPHWIEYLTENAKIIQDFVYWNLTQFVQLRNPNVPNIAAKLIKPIARKPLTRQKNFWDFIMNSGQPVRCIYTNQLLQPRDYDLDHFIPWRFVTHDLLWDLMPVNPSINSSKSDKLPDICFLPKLARTQQKAIQIFLNSGRKTNLLDDYLTMGHRAEDIAAMPEDKLVECFRNTMEPMEQFARNMGFEDWNYKEESAQINLLG